MGTRARIGIVNADKTISSIYTHSDGYLSHHAPILLDHYTTEAKVRALIALGDLSSLGENTGKKHNWNNPVEGWCRAYHRDGKEPFEIKQHTSRALFLKAVQDCSGEYAYLFDSGRWITKPAHSGRFQSLLTAYLAEKLTA